MNAPPSAASNAPLPSLARHKKILFFGGKGGTGKTTVSAATAVHLAGKERKVLLVSTDPAHNLGHLFQRPIGDKATKLAPGLDAIELDPAQVVNAHLQEVSAALHRLMPPSQHGEINKHMALSEDAPGMEEAALLEKIAIVIEDGLAQYEHIIFDTAPSGHTARLMALPEMMSAWTEGLLKRRDRADRFAQFVREMGEDRSIEDKFFGSGASAAAPEKESQIRQILLRRRQRFTSLRERIADPAQCAFIIVLAAERLPVLETIELYQRLSQSNIPVAALAVNKRVPAAESQRDHFLSERHRQEEQHLQTLSQALGHLPRQDFPLAPQDVLGLDALRDFIN